MNILRLSYFIVAILATCHSYTSEPPIVVACSFDTISRNADTGNIVDSALQSARHIFSCLSWSSLLSLPSTTSHMKERGIAIAQKTPGITNTIKKLFTELEEQQYGKFTDTAITCFNEMGVNPIPDGSALSLLAKVKSFKIPTIGMGNQDSAEHEIYSRKLLQGYNVHIPELFDGIVTIPTITEERTFDLDHASYSIHNPKNPRWLVAHDAKPSDCFTATLKKLASDLAGQAPLWAVESKEQLAIVVNALHIVYQHHHSTTERRKKFEEVISHNQIIAPTKV